MLPKKVVIAVVIASLLLLGYEGLDDKQIMKQVPNLLLGFALVGAFSAAQSLKDLTRIH